MSLVFYYAPMSTASISEAVLAELGTPHERVRMEFGPGGTQGADFLAINPNGRVPVIVHDGVAIWESCAITLYLGETFGVAAGLYPPPGTKRGEAMKWIAWGNVSLGAAGLRLAYAQPRGGAAGQAALEEIGRCLAVLDGALRGEPYVLRAYSLVDTHLWALVGWIGMLGVDMAPYSKVAEWLRRCGDRPALAKIFGG